MPYHNAKLHSDRTVAIKTVVTFDTAVGKNRKYIWVVTCRVLFKFSALWSLSSVQCPQRTWIIEAVKRSYTKPTVSHWIHVFGNIQDHLFTIMSQNNAKNQPRPGWRNIFVNTTLHIPWGEEKMIHKLIERERAEWKCNNDIRRRQVVLVMSCPISRCYTPPTC